MKNELELARYIDSGLKAGCEIHLQHDEDYGVFLCIDYFEIVRGRHYVESILGTLTIDGFEIYLVDESGEKLVKTYGNIHGALSYVFTELLVHEVRANVHKIVQSTHHI